MRERGGLLAGTVALLGLLVLASPASAAKDQEASFKIEVFASQHSTWTSDFTTAGCGGGTSHAFGNGEQGFSLTTNKPVKVKVTRSRFAGTTLSWFKYPPGAQGVPVNVAAVREGVSEVESIGGEPCGDGDGGTQPPPSDCGARSFSGEVILDYFSPTEYPDAELTPLVDVLALSGPVDATGAGGDVLFDELYPNCPAVGSNGGQLLLSPNGGLSPKKLFGKKERFTVKAEDTVVTDTSSSHEESRMSWNVKFKRR